ncbi:MAG: hypothetical protein V4507_04685 [Verrucomicrobiota bacterium]
MALDAVTSSTPSVPYTPSAASVTAIAQARQTLTNASSALLTGVSTSPATSNTAPETYTPQIIYNSLFANAISSGNSLVTKTGSGKTTSLYTDSAAAIAAGNNGLATSRSLITTQAFSMLSSSWGSAAPGNFFNVYA